MVRRTGLVTVMGLLALFLALGAAWAQPQDGGPVFRIGVLDDERGPISMAARFAVRSINDAGGVIGADGTQFRLELVIEPTTTGDTLAAAINNLAAAQIVAVIGPQTGDVVLSNLPLLQSLRVPILTPAVGDTVVASDSTGLIFRTRAAERFQGAALADLLVNGLNIRNVTVAQLDRMSTGERVGFSLALAQTGQNVQENTLLLEIEANMENLIADSLAQNTAVIVAYGAPELAAAFYNGLRDAGYAGVFAYNQSHSDAFQSAVAIDELPGILGATTWTPTATDSASSAFMNDFVRATGRAPGPIEAATFDAVNLLAEALSQPGELATNLNSVRNVPGIQGIINADGLPRGELTDGVIITQLNALGGPVVVARYARGVRLVEEPPPPPEPAEPTPTPTPEGVNITILSTRQNVRTGPGLEYDVLGQLRQGEQARVIGATLNFDWVVISYRGQNGWLATYLLEVFGDLNTVPVFQPPPTPTPPPATDTPTPQPIADVLVVAAAPSNITLGVPTTINVTVRNQGGLAAGRFAVAATFLPDNAFSAYNLSGLAAGADQVIPLEVTLNNATGNFEVVIVADLNNEVPESPEGEANNFSFIFSYKVDRQLILINNTNLNSGGLLDLEGNLPPQYDIQYTGAGLNTTAVCTGTENCIGLLSPVLTWDTAHYDAISPATGINTTFIPNAALTPGTTIGILTAEGRRGVIRVDNINPGVSITLTYRVYQ